MGLFGGIGDIFSSVTDMFGLTDTDAAAKQQAEMEALFNENQGELNKKRQKIYDVSLQARKSQFGGNWSPGVVTPNEGQKQTGSGSGKIERIFG